MESLIEEIVSLTKEWYLVIGPRHHKDRDCHWYINTKWSYGEQPTYLVEHYGYVYGEVKIECETYEKALLTLKKELKSALEEEKKYYEIFE